MTDNALQALGGGEAGEALGEPVPIVLGPDVEPCATARVRAGDGQVTMARSKNSAWAFIVVVA